MIKRFRGNQIYAADLFCGAGGTSTGLVEACEALEYKVELTAINHWKIAVATHFENHPSARHLCASLDSLNPRELFVPGKLDILWASPECTHHSNARGGKPINDQSRATAWCVTRWAEALHPPIILVENVVEFLSWGPCAANGRPLKRRKGEIFMAWVNTLRAIGYQVDWKILCAADYGDPTTRRRLFIQAVLKPRQIVWPEPTHSETKTKGKLPWNNARGFIDFSKQGRSVFNRPKPLAAKTIRRTLIGLDKFGLAAFTVHMEHQGSVQGVDKPLATVTTAKGGAIGVAQPYIIGSGGPAGSCEPSSVDKPLRTVLVKQNQYLVEPKLEPFLLPQQSHGNRVRDVNRPLQTVTTESRGVGVAQPYIVNYHGDHAGKTDGDARVESVDQPVPTLDTSNRLAVAQPYLVKLRGTNNANSIDKPASTVTSSGSHLALAKPYLVNMKGQSTAMSADQPAPTVTSHSQHLAVAEPFVVDVRHGNGKSKTGDSRRSRSVDAPLGAVTGSNGPAVAEPFVIGQQSGAAPRSVDAPLPTVAGAGAIALAQPYVVTTDHKGGNGNYVSPIDKPLPTVTGAPRHAVADPFLVQYYGASAASSVDAPLPTTTVKARFGLCEPVICADIADIPVVETIEIEVKKGKVTELRRYYLVEVDGYRYLRLILNGVYHLVDIFFRMLNYRELAEAQGFLSNYRFVGTNTEIVKQIGNAVPRRLAGALVRAAVSQNPN